MKQEIKLWDGKGLPQVDTWCEVKIHGDWHRCEIIAHVKQPAAMVAVFAAETNGVGNGKEIDYFVADRFRPIQSERDKAIESAAEIIRKEHMSRAINSIDCPHKASAIALENAGLLRLPEGDV